MHQRVHSGSRQFWKSNAGVHRLRFVVSIQITAAPLPQKRLNLLSTWSIFLSHDVNWTLEDLSSMLSLSRCNNEAEVAGRFGLQQPVAKSIGVFGDIDMLVSVRSCPAQRVR